MLDVRSQLLRLRQIQDLVLTLQAARSEVEAAPARLEAIEGAFRERNSEYVQIKERYDELERDRASRQFELTELEDARKKFMDSLMQVKNQREYAAVLKEIDTVKARISEHEDTILKSMAELETLRTDLEARAAHIEGERRIVEEERTKVDAEVAEAQGKIAEVETARARIEAELPIALVASVRRVEENRKGIFLVAAERETCTACHVRVRPQVFQEIKNATKIHACSNCRRFLYEETSLRAAAAAAATAAAGAPIAGNHGVETLNGGAI